MNKVRIDYFIEEEQKKIIKKLAKVRKISEGEALRQIIDDYVRSFKAEV
jgi:hypothetical protein